MHNKNTDHQQLLKLVYEAVRSEDVVLWVGAGMSLYAGYLSGKELSNNFYNQLNPIEREGLNQYNLQIVTQALVDLTNNTQEGSDKIIKLLRNEYINKRPKSKKYHAKLSNIPHIKTIITTNYDRLFELSYKEKGQVIFRDEDLINLNVNKTQIFKIHGDLADPKTIILTKDDYGKFFLNDNRKNIWTVIGERISTKTQVFLGYSLEDDDVMYTLEKTWNNIGEFKKNSYLIAPNLPNHKIAYLKNKGISYINSTGEKFIDGLFENARKNIIKDFNNNKLGTEVLRTFLDSHDLFPTIVGSTDKYNIKAIAPKREGMKGIINFTVNKEYEDDLNNFILGKKFGEYEFPLKSLNLTVKKIPLLDFEETESLVFKFKTPPKFEKNVDIKFSETNFEINNIPMKVFISEHRFELHLDLRQGSLIVNSKDESKPFLRFGIEATHYEKFGKVKDELEYYNFIFNLFSGHEFTIYDDKNSFTKNIGIDENAISDAKFFINYFEKLQRIEKHFKVRFTGFEFSSINEKSCDLVNKLIGIIDNNIVENIDNDGWIMKLDIVNENSFKNFLAIINSKEGFDLIDERIMYTELHNQKINLGFKVVRLKEIYPINFEGFTLDNPYVKIKSKKKQVRIYYYNEYTNFSTNNFCSMQILNITKISK